MVLKAIRVGEKALNATCNYNSEPTDNDLLVFNKWKRRNY